MRGLSSTDAAARLAQYGPNALPAQPPRPLWRRFLAQFDSPLIFILLFALLFDAGLWLHEGAEGWPVEAVAIAVILLLNAALGMYQEQRSEAALAHLRALTAAQAWALRDGQLVRVPSATLVPGDCVRLDAGDRVPADGVLAEAHGTMLDESVLTGESVPVDKTTGDEVFSATLLVRGSTMLEIHRTGPASAMGRLATMLADVTAVATPLERRVDALGRQIARWVLALAVAICVMGVAVEGVARAPQMLIFAVALAVAAVPEGLPAVLTVALALGVERMARHHAVVRRLAAVEALGSVTIIATDKTGTITENRMDVRAVESPDPRRALEAMVLASDADLDTGAGDPLELGLLRHARAQGLDPLRLRSDRPVLSQRPFDSAWKFSRVTVREPQGPATYVKGAPEVILARCTLSAEAREAWHRTAETHAGDGVRLLGLAWSGDEREDGWTFLGLVLLWDPPRPEVMQAISMAQDAGIRIVMITGDHPATARAVAGLVGLTDPRVSTGAAIDAAADQDALAALLRETNVFARVRPEQKLRLVETLQASGHIVAMTGDGVNDAPALKRSDVGVAMGQRGSDVTREVADLVLVDDNFATIVGAIEEGRSIYANIQTFLRFLFSTNLSEVLLLAGGAVLAVVLGLRDETGALLLPLTAAQILWINLVTDGLPALALAFDRNPGVMRQPPRPPASPLLDRPSLQFVVGVGTMKALIALALLGLVPAWGYDLPTARAVAFHVMAIGQLLLTYPARHTRERPLPNPVLHAAVAAGVVVQLLAAWMPATAKLLGDAALPGTLWVVVFGAAGLAWVLAETVARLAWRRAATS